MYQAKASTALCACSADAAPVLEQETAELKRIVEAKYPDYDSEASLGSSLDLGEACCPAHWYPAEPGEPGSIACNSMW